MLILDQVVEVKIGTKTLKHYINLGYKVKVGDIIMIRPEHLTSGSHVEVKVQCDNCGIIMDRPYKTYLTLHDGGDLCNKCKSIKSVKTCKEKYGVDYPSQTVDVQEKMKKTCLEKYGVEHIFQLDSTKEKWKETLLSRYGVYNPQHSQIIREKAKQTNIEKYGTEYTFQSEVVKDKIKQSIFDRYGVENISQNKQIKEKKKLTTYEHYGVENPMQSEEIQKKIHLTLYQNGTCPTSKQQLSIFNMLCSQYGEEYVKLNYPVSRCSLDIRLEINNIYIDIEYDGSYWHQDKQKDIRRDKFIQSYGYKVLRIKYNDKVPTLNQLQDAINELSNTDKIFILLTPQNDYNERGVDTYG